MKSALRSPLFVLHARHLSIDCCRLTGAPSCSNAFRGWQFVQTLVDSPASAGVEASQVCETSMPALRSLCADDIDECITYMSLGGNASSVAASHLGADLITERLWLLTTSPVARV